MNSGKKYFEMHHRKWIASVFIVTYICTTTLSLLPVSKIRNALFDPIRPLVLYSGLWQNFILFAPDPPKSNVGLTATITKRNGETAQWQHPVRKGLNIFDHCNKERYVSFCSYYANYNEVFRPDFARFIARSYRDDGNPPQTVTLERYWSDIPPPNIGLSQAVAPTENHCPVFTYSVKSSDLQ
ncbi:MAG: hypothetical protein JST89_15370 [Cyanobacteria bacterium SZAS-4]|nr:hypothetical protein [Cyanobacteria bacterium SZAS-4]